MTNNLSELRPTKKHTCAVGGHYEQRVLKPYPRPLSVWVEDYAPGGTIRECECGRLWYRLELAAKYPRFAYSVWKPANWFQRRRFRKKETTISIARQTREKNK